MPLTSLSEAASAFSEFENRADVHRLVIRQTPVWELIRYRAFQALCVKAGIISDGHPHTPINGHTVLATAANILKSGLSRMQACASKEKTDLLVVGHPRRQLSPSGCYEDPYSEPYLKHSRHRACYVERSFRGHYAQPRSVARRLLTDDYHLLGARLKCRFSNTEKRQIVALEQHFARFTGHQVQLSALAALVLGQRSLLLPFYLKLIKKLEPKIGIVVVGYLNPAFIEACRRSHLPVVEIQHGVISKFHYGYHHNTGFPRVYYPDYLWLWGDYWKSAADYGPKTKLRSVGFPLFDRHRGENQRGRSNTCLFISQGSIGRKIADKAKALRQSRPDLEIVFRLHPSEFDSWDRQYGDLALANVKVAGSEDGSIYSWFERCKYVIGGYSTALFEAAGMGCRVGVLKLAGIEYMAPLIAMGGATRIDSRFDALFSDGANGGFNGGHIFKPYSSDQIERLLEMTIYG